MFDLLKELSLLNGTSGREHDVRNYIIDKVKKIDGCSYSVDALGNLTVMKKGNSPASKTVLFDAHMDEVGMIVTYITDEGFLKFANVGGINSKVQLGKAVTVNGKVGVIGVTPIHLLSKENERNMPAEDEIYIDIGASSREEAEKYVSIGDSVYFISDYVEFGNDMVKAKAIDDRLGCAIMLKLLENIEEDFICNFSVQEEIGCRGAGVVANTIKPDYAIVIESTTASDIEGVSGENVVCEVGKGAVISFMDRGTLYDKDLYSFAMNLAKEKDIKAQTKTVVAGGNNASVIHTSAGGIKTITVSVPCRYLHSPSCVIKKEDANSVYDIVKELLLSFAYGKDN